MPRGKRENRGCEPQLVERVAPKNVVYEFGIGHIVFLVYGILGL